MGKENRINSRIILKHDIEANWNQATGFKPLRGEIIIYEKDENYDYERYKIGDGENFVKDLPFVTNSTLMITHGEQILSNIINTYILNIDYSELEFDTTEILFNTNNTTSVLGQAILGQMVLA